MTNRPDDDARAGRHDGPLRPHGSRGPIGDPLEPRSALKLRLVLAIFGFIVCASAAASFAVLAIPVVLMVTAAVFAVIALADIAVIVSRMRRDGLG
ncbi:DUF6343 family protein [Kribbella sp. NPDC023855]|uniref:DUF6343 family protein n=1 Tax=Kribbella sp. NPDC023855 TaxID=3154698 RepID=UPI0033D9B4E3